MQYYTRLFHDTRVPYCILDDFTVYEEAEHYSEEFYQKLLAEREEELREFYGMREVHAFSGENVVEEAELWKRLPGHTKIEDARVFFLRGISPSAMKHFRDEQRKQDAEWAALWEKIKEREKADRERMPKHWLPLLEAAWIDGFIELTQKSEKKISAVAHFDDRRVARLEFGNATVNKEVEEEYGTRILFAEVLWEDGMLRLNILTRTNEISILAEDVELEWLEED